MRSVAVGGVIGGLPGLLIALVPLMLYEFDVISSDASQIGFIGVPVLFIGVIVGMLMGAAGSGSSGRVVFGAIVGFVVGVALGIWISTSTGVGGGLLLITPMAMIVGGALGARSVKAGPGSSAAPQA
jgi:hypothetical protein